MFRRKPCYLTQIYCDEFPNFSEHILCIFVNLMAVENVFHSSYLPCCRCTVCGEHRKVTQNVRNQGDISDSTTAITHKQRRRVLCGYTINSDC
jgi:hypothetical protein